MTITAVVSDAATRYSALLASLNTSPSAASRTVEDVISDTNSIVILTKLAVSMAADEDTMQSGGTLQINSQAMISESNDIPNIIAILNGSGFPINKYVGIINVANDALTSSGIINIHGFEGLIEHNDTIVSMALTRHKSNVIINEANDTIRITGISDILGRNIITEGPDSIISLAKLHVRANTGVGEHNDQLVSIAKIIEGAKLSGTEGSDTVNSISKIHIRASSICSDYDEMASTAITSLASSASITESNDTLSFGIHTTIKASFLAVESDDQVYEQTGRYQRVVLTNLYTTNGSC